MGPNDEKPLTGRVLRQSRSRPIVGKKNSPERLTKLLNYIIQFPQINRACAMAGLTVPTLKSYLLQSEKGQPGDGFDLTYGEEKETKRFHLHFADCRDAAVQTVEDAYISYGLKHYEVLSDKGRVIYQIDPELAGLGVTGPDAYLLDEDNRPIPERIEKQDPDVLEKVLVAYRRERWGHSDKLDVSVRGGVMVVGVRAKLKEVEAGEQEALTAPVDVEFREVEDD
jgi:hypothetical protein